MGPNYTLSWKPKLNRWEVHYSLTHPGSMLREVITWCWVTFGHPGTNPETGVKSLWDYHGGWIYFYDEKYVTMYSLKWA